MRLVLGLEIEQNFFATTRNRDGFVQKGTPFVLFNLLGNFPDITAWENTIDAVDFTFPETLWGWLSE